MAQNTVFAQVSKLIPRTKFQSIVFKNSADKGVRSLTAGPGFGALLFRQLTGHASIRAIKRVIVTNGKKMKSLRFGPVRKSTLADANKSPPIEVLKDLFQYCLGRVYEVAPTKTGFRFKGEVFALDSSTIELYLSLCSWAQFHHGNGACKLHTAIDVANDLPQFSVNTEGRTHDIKHNKRIPLARIRS